MRAYTLAWTVVAVIAGVAATVACVMILTVTGAAIVALCAGVIGLRLQLWARDRPPAVPQGFRAALTGDALRVARRSGAEPRVAVQVGGVAVVAAVTGTTLAGFVATLGVGLGLLG